MLSDSFVKPSRTIQEAEDALEQERQQALLEEMGLEGRETEKLRKMMLDSNEAVAAKREELERIRQHKGLKSDWDEYLDVKRRMGRVMHHSDFIRQLRRVIPSLIVAPGAQRNRVGLYVVKNVPADEIKDYRGQWHHVECPLYVGWLELGYMPEYEIDICNDAFIAIAQKRGWRTLLLRLIMRRTPDGKPSGVITESQAEKTFGYPTQGVTASGYKRQLWMFRNEKPKLGSS